MKTCPRCEDPTPLPYMCRLCWRAIGTLGQMAFYIKIGRGGSVYYSARRPIRGDN